MNTEEDDFRCDLDIGDSHQLQFVCWRPDRDINPQYADLPDIEKCGAIIRHLTPRGQPHQGFVQFDSDVARKVFKPHALWAVQSWEPLTISPSVACSCGDHGFIREGKWVRA